MKKSSFKILLVEDEALAVMALKMKLKKAGYTNCYIVATGEEAITIIKEGTPDLILMDIRLAGKLTGIEVAQQVHKLYQIPIIFMTGYTDKELMEQIHALKPIDIFIKPLTISKLLTTIDFFLNNNCR